MVPIIFWQILCIDLHEIWNLRSQDSNWPHLKLHEVPSFRCRDIYKTILAFCLILNFQCILLIFTNMNFQSLLRWIITEWSWNFFCETRFQNGPISVKRNHQSQLIFCILRLSHKHIEMNTLVFWCRCIPLYDTVDYGLLGHFKTCFAQNNIQTKTFPLL